MNINIEDMKSVQLTSGYVDRVIIETQPSEKADTSKFVTEWEYLEG